MTYEALNYTNYGLYAGLAILCCLLALAIGVASYVITLYFQNPERQRQTMQVFTGIIVILIMTAIGFFIADEQIEHSNQSIAERNLNQKYGFKKVLWESPDTTAYANGHIGTGNLAILDKNGKEKVYRYIVNPDNHEPTLTNLPNHPESTVESLKKDKQG